jgi:hypothetical protein
MRRILLGLISIVFLTAGIGVLSTNPDGNMLVLASACIRVGLVLGAVWLAYAQLEKIGQRVSPIGVVVALLCCIIVAARPKLLVYFLPVLILLALLHIAGWFTKPARNGKKSRVSRKPNSARKR